MNEKEIIKEIKERIIEPFYCFPNPTSIELKDKDVNLIEELIDLYIKLQYKLEVEKIDNKYNQEERDEETIPRYKIRELLKEIQEQYERYLFVGNEARNRAYEICINKLNKLLEEN